MFYFTKLFWLRSVERAVRTFAQTLAAMILTDATGLLDVAWGASLSVAGLAALGAILTAVAAPSRVYDPSDEWVRVHPEDEHLFLGYQLADEAINSTQVSE